MMDLQDGWYLWNIRMRQVLLGAVKRNKRLCARPAHDP
jgi:hypothetical protein